MEPKSNVLKIIGISGIAVMDLVIFLVFFLTD